MQIQLVSHASVIITTPDCKIWTDPWLLGKAFNDSWSLLPRAQFDESAYQDIDYMWLSHEHPDHFHIPTLKSMPDDFKKRVTVLFQKNNSDKVIAALRRFGFQNIQLLPHRKIVPLTDQTKVYCCQIGGMDSSLAVQAEGETILNINDCEANKRDCRRFRRDLGPIDVVLNQFSAAGYGGYEDHEQHLTKLCDQILDNVCSNHRDLGAKVTIPFASFVYFSSADNAYMNPYANTPQDVVDRMSSHGYETAILYPGDSYRVNSVYDSATALERFAEVYANSDELPYDETQTVPLDEIQTALHDRAGKLHERFPRMLLWRLKPVTIRIPDLDQVIRLSIPDNEFEVVSSDTEPDLTIYSQPLHFSLKWPWGLQTLGVSARLTLHKNQRNWKRHRILFSLDNAELYLKPKLFFTKDNLRWIFHRLPGSVNQLRYKLERMLPAS